MPINLDNTATIAMEWHIFLNTYKLRLEELEGAMNLLHQRLDHHHLLFHD